MLEEAGHRDTGQSSTRLGAPLSAQIKKLPTYHAIILAKNDIGRVNLVPAGLIVTSEVLTTGRPRMPKSVHSEVPGGTDSSDPPVRRESFIAASVATMRPEPEIAKLVNFMITWRFSRWATTMFMIEREDYEDARDGRGPQESEPADRGAGRTLPNSRWSRPATCIFSIRRMKFTARIIMASKGFKDADRPGAALPAHDGGDAGRNLHTWGARKRIEVVITNTVEDCKTCVKKFLRCGRINVRRSSSTLTRSCADLCYEKAHEIYGPNPFRPDRGGAAGAGAEFHHFEWVCGYVHHRPEACVEVQCTTAIWLAHEARSARPLSRRCPVSRR